MVTRTWMSYPFEPRRVKKSFASDRKNLEIRRSVLYISSQSSNSWIVEEISYHAYVRISKLSASGSPTLRSLEFNFSVLWYFHRLLKTIDSTNFPTKLSDLRILDQPASQLFLSVVTLPREVSFFSKKLTDRNSKRNSKKHCLSKKREIN